MWSVRVPGQTVQLQLVTDDAENFWGFAVDAVQSYSDPYYHLFLPLIVKPAPTPTSFVVCACNTVEVCTCNLVCTCDTVCSCVSYCSCNTVCSCVSYCSCNTVCTCDTICTGQDNHYGDQN